MQFFRIKNYYFNLESLSYIRLEESYIEFGFGSAGGNFIRLEKGSHLQEAEYEQVKDFVLNLPDPDRVIVV